MFLEAIYLVQIAFSDLRTPLALYVTRLVRNANRSGLPHRLKYVNQLYFFS